MEIVALIGTVETKPAEVGVRAGLAGAVNRLLGRRPFASPRAAREGLAGGYDRMAARRAAAGDPRGAAYYAAHARALAAIGG